MLCVSDWYICLKKHAVRRQQYHTGVKILVSKVKQSKSKIADKNKDHREKKKKSW